MLRMRFDCQLAGRVTPFFLLSIATRKRTLQLRLLVREVAAVADDLAEPALKLSMTLVVHKVARSSMGNSRSESGPPT